MSIVDGGAASCEPWHLVQLFDHAESLSDTVASFMREGFSAGDRLLIVMKPQLWNRTAAKLDRHDVAIAEAIASGQLTVLDSRRTLARFIVRGMPDAQLFDDSVGRLVRELTADETPLRVYGDMVDVLAEEGEFTAAQRLEALWNHLHGTCSFALFCGYLAPNFADARTAKALREICELHDQVRSTSDDSLSVYLLDSSGSAHPRSA